MNEVEERIEADYETQALNVGNAILRELMMKEPQRFSEWLADSALNMPARYALKFEAALRTVDEVRSDRTLGAEFLAEQEKGGTH